MEKKIIERDTEVLFTNWTNEDFEGMWNKKIYPLKAGKSYYFPLYLAEHFGKHLVDRELNKLNPKNPGANEQQRQEMMDKCVQLLDTPDIGVAAVREVPLREVKLKAQERSEQYVQEGIARPEDMTALPRTSSKQESPDEFPDLKK